MSILPDLSYLPLSSPGNVPCLSGLNPICCPPMVANRLVGVQTLPHLLLLCIPTCFNPQIIPRGVSKNCEILATSKRALVVAVTAPPRINDKPPNP